MKDRATVALNSRNEEIFVTVDIRFSQPVGRFVFSVNTSLQIDEISSDAVCTHSRIREWSPMFRDPCGEYEVSFASSPQSLKIAFHGKITGWANIVETNRIALSSYSAWFPQQISMALDMVFVLEDMEDYFVLNARYDAPNKVWIYGEHGYDTGNIIALKKNKYDAATIDEFTFYYVNPEEAKIAEYLVLYYRDIMRYYHKTFGKRDLAKLDVVSLGKDGGGAYFRKELIVAENMSGKDDDDAARRLRAAFFLAHELGHNWFTGADTGSWEDWLNETGATWASLLYALDTGNDVLFEYTLSWPKEHYLESPAIRSSDGSRPASGVHERGTMLLYEIYQRFGKETVLTILWCFLEIGEKTTARLLSALEPKVGSEVMEFLHRGLTATDYDSLAI